MPRLLRRAVLALAALLLPAVAQAQDWPTKPITLYMGFPAGSGVDVVARMLQPSLEKSLGQRLVIDYKPGAGGNVASEVVARAPADGYTFLLGDRRDARRQCRALQEAVVRRRGGLHADLHAERRLQRADDQSQRDRRRLGEGLHRQGEGRARQVQLRLDRQRHGHPSRLRRVRAQGRPRHGARALQGRAGGDPGRAGRRHLLHLQPGADGAAAVARRQGAAAGRHHRPSACPRSPTCRRSTRPACPATRATPGSASSDRRVSIRRSPPR